MAKIRVERQARARVIRRKEMSLIPPDDEKARASRERNENPIAFGMLDYDVESRARYRRIRRSEIREGIRISYRLFFIRAQLPRFDQIRCSVSSITECHKCIGRIDDPTTADAAAAAVHVAPTSAWVIVEQRRFARVRVRTRGRSNVTNVEPRRYRSQRDTCHRG